MINNPVSIIIPVFNAFDATLDCILSVLKHSPQSVNIIVIDDQSSKGVFSDYFKTNFLNKGNSQPQNLKLLQNEKNLGFVGTCNRGMILESGADDIILLNSDTVVTKDWVSKLQYAAYSSADIATVTPLTNNGTICSIPKFISDNELPDFLSLDDYADLVENTSKRLYPKLPTCVGFCTYIKRSVLDRIGYFDPAFSKGYGEENDLSLRCQKIGLKDILDDATFIHHKGSLSFGDMKAQLSKDNTAIIAERYPNFFPEVSLFCSENPLREIQERIQNALVMAYEEKHPLRILHILHNGPFQEYNHGLGGTEMHVRELIKGLPEFTHWSLIIKVDHPLSAFILSAHLQNIAKTIHIPVKAEWLENIISPDFFDCIHIHHTLHYDRAELAGLCSNHPNVIYSIHDYYSLCPFIYMRTKLNQVCTGVECISDCALTEEYIKSFRESSANVLSKSKHVMAFSESTKEVLNRIFGSNIPVKVIPHGISSVIKPESRNVHMFNKSVASPVKIAFLSPLIYHKGKELIIESSKQKVLSGGKPIEWHLWSEVDPESIPPESNLILHGKYDRASLGKALNETGIDLIVIPSLCMETFSYTLTESWNCGLPVVVTPYGALKERVESAGAGWVLKDESVESLIGLLGTIFSGDTTEYTAKQILARNTKLTEISEELSEYRKIYSGIQISAPRSSVLNHIQADMCTPAAPRPPQSVVKEEKSGIKQRIKSFIVESSNW